MKDTVYGFPGNPVVTTIIGTPYRFERLACGCYVERLIDGSELQYFCEEHEDK